MGIGRQLQEYLFLRKRDPKAPINTNIRLMHWMNRIAIFMFLVALVVLLVRLFRYLLR